jgi:hypothetical protein
MANMHKNNHEEELYCAQVREKYAHESTLTSKKAAYGQFGIAVIVIIAISAIVYGIFNYGGITSSSTSSSIVLPSIVEQPEDVAEYKVSLDKLVKGFHDHSYSPQITYTLTFANNTDKDIRGFEGIVTFSDIFDNEIESLKFSYDEGLKSHYEVTIEKATDYNPYIDSSVKLKEVKNENLKYKWKVATILYDDGTRETY